MRVLLDNNLDHRFARLLPGHDVAHARHMGWTELQNGEPIAAGEEGDFDVLITGDKNLRYQQNLNGRTIRIITLDSRFIDLKGTSPLAPQVLVALANLPEGSFLTIAERENF